MKLKGKVAVVTGSGRGIGKAIALAMAKEGADIVSIDIMSDNTEKTAKECQNMGVKAISITADVGNREDMNRAAEIVFKTWKKEELKLILVNNAGITRDALFLKMTDKQWDEVIRTNLTGVFYCCKVFAPVMVENGYGKIINISSIVGKTGNVGQANYSATKSGIIGFTKTLAKELAWSAPINVNAIQPGFIKTAMTDAIPDKVKERLFAHITLKRLGMPEDVAHLTVFLASEESNFITGAVIPCTGGTDM
ncbi:MAG: beta-ketoacyl-ACP reductase [Candidatus Helarchaeota archaeon]